MLFSDELFGSLCPKGLFSENSLYQTRPMQQARHHLTISFTRGTATVGPPVIITNCSNKFGAYQFPEKLIPLMILSALADRHLPVYSHGQNIRTHSAR